MSSTHGEVQKLIDDHPTANGLVVVLTNDYESSHLPTLGDACHKDGDEMEETFKNMFGFACFRRKNTTGSEIKAIIKAVGEINYSPTYKCVAIAFSGHGKKDSVQGNDKGTVKIYEDFVGPLQPRRKGHLNNVPKLFFFDACRGSLEMRRLREKGTVDERGGFYLAYATTEGFTAYLQSKWMPKVAQKLRDRSNVGKTVQEVVGKVTKEFRESSEPGYQCPQCDDTYGPVYIHSDCISGEELSSGTASHSSSTTDSGVSMLGKRKRNDSEVDFDVSETRETKSATVHGVIRDVSALKTSKDKRTQYFDAKLTDGKKTVRFVCFEPELRKEIFAMENKEAALSNCRVQKSKISGRKKSLEIVASKSTNVIKSPRQFIAEMLNECDGVSKCVIRGEIVEVKSCDDYRSCKNCKKKVTVLKTFAECKKCKNQQRLSKCGKETVAKLVIEDRDGEESTVTAFTEVLNEITQNTSEEASAGTMPEKLLSTPTMNFTLKENIVQSISKVC